jgi:hypothetical protein
MASPNVLVIMTDEERCPPPYETAEVAEFRRTQMPAREQIRDGNPRRRHSYNDAISPIDYETAQAA